MTTGGGGPPSHSRSLYDGGRMGKRPPSRDFSIDIGGGTLFGWSSKPDEEWEWKPPDLKPIKSGTGERTRRINGERGR